MFWAIAIGIVSLVGLLGFGLYLYFILSLPTWIDSLGEDDLEEETEGLEDE